MSQDIFSLIDPDISGTELATALTGFKDAVVSGLSGTTRPTELDAGGMWVDTTLDPASWSLKLWTGTVDIELVKIDLSLSVAYSGQAVDTFSVRKISADSVGPILELVKRRIATNGQVASGDVVGEVRIVGRTNTSTDPVVAKLIWTAGENQTATAFGGTLSLWSTPAGSATLVEHLKLAAGQLESVVAHKLNALILASQAVATTATINQLDATKTVVEMTGTTATEIRGINSSQATKVITLHARTSGAGAITIKHENASATAADRFTLPGAKDMTIPVQSSATFIYSVADSRWKLQSKSSDFSGFTTTTIYPGGSWVAPAGVTQLKVVANRTTFPNYRLAAGGAGNVARSIDGPTYAWGYNIAGQVGDGTVVNRSSPTNVVGGLLFSSVIASAGSSLSFSFMGITPSGKAYAWGDNYSGQLGVGDVISRSSPVAVLGGISFASIYLTDSGSGVTGDGAYGISTSGTLYAWGENILGRLGVGDIIPRSSPVAVLGGLTFQKVVQDYDSVLALASNGTLYAWGRNDRGQLGLGDVAHRSSPVQVLGGLTFKDVAIFGKSGGGFAVGITTTGVAYAWGYNAEGCLGVGDTIPRSSPVAVLGGLTFKSIKLSTYYAIGLTSSGAAYAWGGNVDGGLGVGNTVSRSSPVQVLGGLTFKKIALSIFSSYGLTPSGTLYAWGLNSTGELGVGDGFPRSSPVAVLGGLTFLDIATPKNLSALAVSSTGAIYAWGGNGLGQLGVGDTVDKISPTLVVGGINLGTSVAGYAIYDIAVTPGNTYTFTVAVDKCLFGTLATLDNTESLDLEYIVP